MRGEGSPGGLSRGISAGARAGADGDPSPGASRGGGGTRAGSAAGRFTSPPPFVSLQGVCASPSLSPRPRLSPARPAGTSPRRAAAEPPQGGRRQRCWWDSLAVQPAGNMATGGYRSAGGSTTDFLEEWKAKREKMRAKQAPTAPGAAAGGESRPAGGACSAELNNNLPPGGPAAPPDRPAPPAGGAVNCVSLAAAALGRAAPGKEPPPPALAGGRGAEPAAKPPPAAAASASAAPGSPEGEEKLAAKGKSSGPSARKGKGQIEKRKLREKRRSTGVVNIPAAEVSPRGAEREGRGAAAAAAAAEPSPVGGGSARCWACGGVVKGGRPAGPCAPVLWC